VVEVTIYFWEVSIRVVGRAFLLGLSEGYKRSEVSMTKFLHQSFVLGDPMDFVDGAFGGDGMIPLGLEGLLGVGQGLSVTGGHSE
jgi:hypothetical protein